MNFERLLPSHYTELTPFFSGQRYQLCTYSLSTVLSWSNEFYQPYGGRDGGALIVAAEFSKRIKDRHLILPLSPAREYGPEELHALALAAGHNQYWFVPEDYIERAGPERLSAFFLVEHQPEFDDYIYSAEDMVSLSGNRYAGKRNHIHRFRKEYLDAGRVDVGAITPEKTGACMAFLEKWCEGRDCEPEKDEDLACEKKACMTTLENFELFECSGIYVSIDGEIEAFGIAARLTEDMGVLHFEKAHAPIKGLYQFLDNQCAKTLFPGCKYINKESDMNLPGLAKAKMSYHPVRKVKSFKLILKGASYA
jgi:hypothetical protein